jgi:NAD(P)-dependent dehydrogenase (short-subunit alcohol dehydrogenase family)
MEMGELYDSIRPRYPEFQGKVALVTGSSMGIGQGIALRLAREGMQVIIHGKEAGEVAATVDALQSLGASVYGIAADFSTPDGVDRLFDAVRERCDRLYLLVNNAADLRRTHFQDASVALLDHQLQVNVRTPYLCCMQAAPLMLPDGKGVMINISSVGGQRAHWKGLPYDMTKGALESMTRAMALDLAGAGVRVNAIAPGAIAGWRTPFIPSDTVKAITGRIPAGRFGTALEIGAAVAFLASDDAAYITGQVLVIDGGISAQLSPPGQPI